MSKVDAQRALRDARYARFAAERAAEVVPAKTAASKPSAVDPAPAKRPPEAPTEASGAEPVTEELFSAIPEAAQRPVLKSASQDSAAQDSAAQELGAPVPGAVGQPDEELCGHRSMNGKSCTRVKDHEQKNHRYN